MAYQFNKVTVRDIGGGIDKRSAESTVPETYSEDIQNAVTNSNGFVSKRPGYQGYYGYLPLRITSIEHAGTDITFSFDSSVDVSTITSTPIVVYGRLSGAQGTGDWTNTDNVEYYSNFTTDAIQTLTAPSGTLAVASSLGTDDIFTEVFISTDSGSRDNEWVAVDSIDVDNTTPFTLDVNYTVAADIEVYVLKEDKSTPTGSSYAQDDSGTVTSPITITAATHGLSNFNVLSRHYYLDGSEWRTFTPDSVTIDESSGEVNVTFSGMGAADMKTVLAAAPGANVVSKSIAASTTDTVVISTTDSFNFIDVYKSDAGTLTKIVPDSIVTDDSADTVTISITNSDTAVVTFKIYYESATVSTSSITVTDNAAGSTTYTDTDPQLTLWGISHKNLYLSSSDSEGHVSHIDTYRREAEERLIAGLGGNIFKAVARTETSADTTYLIPSQEVALDDRVNTDVVIGPTFLTTGDASNQLSASVVTDTTVSDNKALVTDVVYVSSGVAKYTLSFSAKVGDLSTAVSTTSDLEDYLTVTGMAHDINNGTFKITAVDNSNDTITVANSALTLAAFDEAGAQGRAGIFTDTVVMQNNSIYLPDDNLTAAIFGSLTPSIVSSSSASIVMDGLTSEVDLTAGTKLYASRVTDVVPLAATTNFVVGDMCTVTSFTRQMRITNINRNTSDISISTVTAGAQDTFTESDITAATGNIAITTHGLTTSDEVTLSTTGTLPLALTAGSTYFVIKVDANTIRLATTAANATAGTQITFTETGGGGTHTLTTNATVTTGSAHNLNVGDKILHLRTGVDAYNGTFVVKSTPTTTTYTISSSDVTGGSAGVIAKNTVQLDESFTVVDEAGDPATFTVIGRWIPIEAPTSSDDQVKTTYEFHFDSKSYEKQGVLRSTMVNDNLYMTNQNDEVMKFDGTDLYQAGLFRWQPHLFAELDTTTTSIPLSGTVGNVSAVAANKFTVGTGEASQFSSGDTITHDQDAAIYVVQSVDTTNNLVYTTETITGAASGDIKLAARYRYYFRLNAIDANDNIIASAATGASDFIVDLTAAGQIKMRLVGFPLWGIYDYDRIEIEIYRTSLNTAVPFYRVGVKDVSFSIGDGYVDFTDSTTDDFLATLDPVNTALKGAELGTAWTQPLKAKYVTSSDNRLILGNIKDYPQLDIVLRPDSGIASIAASVLTGKSFLFRKDDADTGTVTNMVDRATYEFVNSGETTITPNTDISKTSTTFTVADASHSLVAGDWVYMFHSAAGTINTLTYAGWWQVNSVSAGVSFTVKANMDTAATANDVNRYVVASTDTNIPVWIGADGNYNQTDFDNDNEFVHFVKLANAINASMRMTDTSLSSSPDQSDFIPWMTAHAGSEYGSGRLVIRQDKDASTTVEVKLPAAVTGATWFVDNVVAAAASENSAGSFLFPSRVLVSYPNFPEIFDNPFGDQLSSDSIIDINAADGQEITGIIPFFGSAAFGASQVESTVVVFKTNSIYLLDIASKQVQKIQSRGLGCTAPFSIATTRDGIMFANNSGVYRLNRNQSISYVGKTVERIYQDDVNRDSLSKVTGHHYAIGRQYKLSVPVGGSTQLENNQVLVYDHQREGQQEFGSWTRFTNHAVTGWANLANDAFFGTTKGEVFSIRRAGNSSDYRDDADAVAEMVILLRAEDFGAPGSRKVVNSVTSHFQLRNSSMTGTELFSSEDLDGVFATAGTFTHTKDGFVKVVTSNSSLPRRRLTYLQLKYTNSTKDEDVVLTGLDYSVSYISEKGIPDRSQTT